MKKSIIVMITVVMLIASSCSPVKEYEKNKINDSEMVLAPRKIEKTEMSFQSYREGASGANAGKFGGGCGCN
jgi:PBP1b-binding outer membrane lipoprotein LpoB